MSDTLTVSNINYKNISGSTITTSTITGSVLNISTLSFQSTVISLGQSTNQRYTNFTNGSFAPSLMTSTLSTYNSLSTVTKVSMSQDGRFQYALQSAPSTLSYYQLARSVDTGVTWNTLNTSTMGLPQGSLAYQSTVSGYPTYSNISQSATGQYALASVSGGQLYVSNNANSATPVYTPANVGGSPTIYLPMDSLPITDMMGNTTITVTGSAPLVAGKVGSAINLANTAGGTSSQYLNIPWTGAANFTISFWFYPLNVNGTFQYICSAYAGRINIQINSSNQFYFVFPSGGLTNTTSIAGPTSVLNNTWYNVTAIFQTGGTCSLYVNGTFYGSATNTFGVGTNTTTQISLGSADNAAAYAFNGYIDDFYIYNFAAPNVVLPYIYMPLDGNVVDAMGNVSAANLTATGSPVYVPGVVGNNAISLANPAGGTAVQYIRGSWTYLNNFTVSGWVNFKGIASPGYQIIYSSHNTIILFYVNPSNQIVVQLPSGTGAGFTLITTTFPIITNTWYYLTMIFQINGLCSFYVNNSLIGSFTNSGGYGTVTSSGLFSIGTYDTTTTYAFSGYVDDFKIYNYAVSVSPIAPMNWSHTAVSATGQYMMAAAASGGVFYSTNYGASWSQLTTTQISSLVSPGGAAKTLMGPLIQPNTTAATSATWSVNGVTWTASSSTNNNSANFAAWVAFNTLATSSTSPYSWASNAVYTVGAYTGSVSTSIVGQTAQLGEWIQIQTSTPLVLYSYSYGCGAFTGIPKTHFIVGSNDGSTWYPIQSAVMSNNPLVTSFTACTSYLIVNQSGSQTINGVSPNTGTGTFTTYPPYTTTSYQYFRFIVLSTFGAVNAEFTELFLNFSTPMPLLTAPAIAPSNNTSALTVMPQMTNLAAANWTTPNGVSWKASASTENASYPAYKAFNNANPVNTDKWESFAATYTGSVYSAGAYSTSIQTIGSVGGEWLQIQSSVPLVLTSYSLGTADVIGRMSKTYYIVGSNDANTWYPIQYCNFTSTPFNAAYSATSYINANFSGTQTVTAGTTGSATTTSYSTSTSAYTYFRMITTNLYSPETIIDIGEWYINFTAYTPNPVNALAISNGGQNMLVAATGTTMPNSTAATSNSWTANGINWTASASTSNNTSVWPIYGAFNTVITTSWNSGLFYNNLTGAYGGSTSTSITGQAAQTGEFIQLQSSAPLVLYNYSIATGGWWQMPKTYWIVGSNDNITWFPIQSGTFAANPYNTNYGSSSNYIIANNASAQTFVGNVSTTVTTVVYAPYTTYAYAYFRFIFPSMCGNPGGINAANNDTISIGELFLNFQSGATYLSSNYGSTWSTVCTAPPNAPLLVTSGNGQYTITGTGQLATVYSNATLTTYTIPTLTGINANINCASVSSTGQYMIILTQGTTNNVFYSTNFGITFTGMTVGTLPMTSCAMSYDGFEITVSNASNVYTLNRNTQGYSITMGNQAGLTNQGYNSMAIGNLAGVLNQSANSIILNASGSALDAYNPGFFVAPIQPHNTGNTTSVNLLGYGADSQIVYTGPSVKTDGSFNPFVITSLDAGVSAGSSLTLSNRVGSQVTFTNSLGQGFYNSIVQAGDFGIINRDFMMNSTTPGYFTNSALATGGICIASWSNGTTGLRVSPTGVQMNGIIYMNGNVGIGRTNPTQSLHVRTFTGYSSTAQTVAYFETAQSAISKEQTFYISLCLNDASGGSASGSYASIGSVIPAMASTPLVLQEFGSNVGIGTKNPGFQLTLSTDSAAKPSTSTWTVSSDERIKENIVLADVDRCVEIIRAVPLKHYRWKDSVYTFEQVKDRSKLGWIAQDVEKVFPKAVGTHRLTYNQVYEDVVKEDGSTEKKLVSEDVIEDCRDLNADQIYAVMYGAIQKLITENDSKTSQILTQAEKITLLESQLTAQTSAQASAIAALEARLAALEEK